MKAFEVILRVNKALNWALLISIISIVLIKFVFNDTPEIFKYGAELGQIFYKLSLSVISSYIFYFVVVHLKIEKDRVNLNTFLNSKIDRVINDAKRLVSDFKRTLSLDDKEPYITEVQVEDIFSRVKPTDKAPIILDGIVHNYGNWIQYMYHYTDRSKELIDDIFIKMPFLDSELVKLLSEIRESDFFNVMKLTINLQNGNKDLLPWGKSFYLYTTKCKALEDYQKKTL